MVGGSQHGMMVHVPPWTFVDDPTAAISPFSPLSPNATNSNHQNLNSPEDYSYFLRNDAALRRYLDDDFDGDGSGSGCTDFDISSEAYACDSFRMYEFKVRKCTRGRSHDWTDCPYAHPGEKARRRDPRKFSYSGTACPEFRKGSCKKGDGCEFAHGVFECWLHPQRYRTQPCKDGLNCRRRVCFFAHTAEQLRVLSPPPSDSPLKGFSAFFSSPSEASTPPSESPPMSPMDGSLSRSLGSLTVNDMLTSLRRLQLSKTLQMGRSMSTGPGFCSLPSTPTRALPRHGFGLSEIWEKGCLEEPAMERVESGRGLRVKMFEKLSKENPLDGSDPNPGEGSNPDVGWISELVN